MKIIGIDYGDARIGVAIADSSVGIASPYEVIDNKNLQESIKKLSDLIESEKIEKAVVGMPISLSGHKNQQADKIMDFIEKFKDSTNIDIVAEDERLSTHHADQLAFHQPGKKTDDIAAMLILQSYLDRHK